MMVSSTKKDIRYELTKAEIDGLSDLYYREEDKDLPIRDVADVQLDNGKVMSDSYRRLRQQFVGARLVRASGRKGFFVCVGCDGCRQSQVYDRNTEEVFVVNSG